MGWWIVEKRTPRGLGKIPIDGVRITACGNGRERRYIGISLGTVLAQKMGWTGAEISARIMIGTGPDLGKMSISADAGGMFTAKRSKFGDYRIIVNTTSAAGRFHLQFDPVCIDDVEVTGVNVQNAPRRAIIECPGGLLVTVPAIASAA